MIPNPVESQGERIERLKREEEEKYHRKNVGGKLRKKPTNVFPKKKKRKK